MPQFVEARLSTVVLLVSNSCDILVADRIAEGPLSTGHTRPASSEVPADVPGLESCPMSDEEEPKKSGFNLFLLERGFLAKAYS